MRYGLGILFIAFLVIVGAVILFSGGHNKGSTATVAPKTVIRSTKLADYENNDSAAISWTIQGKLVGQDKRRAIRVIVTRNVRTIQVLDGYDERVENSKDYPNNPAAFATFVRALDNLSFGRERTVKQPDERGVCPLGNRYIYRVTDGSKEVMRTWSDTCTATDGPFGGGPTSPSPICTLFKAQITDYSKLTAKVVL